MTTKINRLESLLHHHVTPHLAKKNVRYTVFALGVVAAGLASFKLGTLPLQFTVIPATLFVLYQKNMDLKAGFSKLTDQQLAEKSARIAYHCLVIAGIWGIVLSGSSLTLGFEGGRLLIRGASSLNPLQVLTSLSSLASIGWLWAPLSLYLLHQSDLLFQNVPNPLLEKMKIFLKTLQTDLNSFTQVKPPLALLTLFFSSAYKTYLPAPFTAPLTALEQCLLSLISHSVPLTPEISEDIEQLKTIGQRFLPAYLEYRKTPTPTPATTQDKTKKIVSGIFHYSITAFAALLPLYMNPLPTLAGLGLGWFYPLGWQSEEMLKKWTVIPNFVDQTVSQNCYYIWRQSTLALNNISSFALIAYPMAISHGFLWAETIATSIKK
jgi:hypothetical protein